jgi:hypothetical protein
MRRRQTVWLCSEHVFGLPAKMGDLIDLAINHRKLTHTVDLGLSRNCFFSPLKIANLNQGNHWMYTIFGQTYLVLDF